MQKTNITSDRERKYFLKAKNIFRASREGHVSGMYALSPWVRNISAIQAKESFKMHSTLTSSARAGPMRAHMSESLVCFQLLSNLSIRIFCLNKGVLVKIPKVFFGQTPKRGFSQNPKRGWGQNPQRGFGQNPKRGLGQNPKKRF